MPRILVVSLLALAALLVGAAPRAAHAGKATVGILGLEVSASPAYGPLAGVALLKVRYF